MHKRKHETIHIDNKHTYKQTHKRKHNIQQKSSNINIHANNKPKQ